LDVAFGADADGREDRRDLRPVWALVRQRQAPTFGSPQAAPSSV
jgi:hypothetical protein